ncbi:MAG: hypothetical protein QOK02_4763 [Mycobacterium sp.]|nr:hypothetical protein [Mycobacterium sp.]
MPLTGCKSVIAAGGVINDHELMSAIDSEWLNDAVGRYAGWLESRPDLTDALCWTAARTDEPGAAAMRLLSPDWSVGDRVELDGLAGLSFEDPDAPSAREHRGWLVETGTHVGVLELNGFGGSVLDNVRAWSITFPATAGMFWNVNSVNQLIVGRRSEPEIYEMLIGEPTDTLGPVLGGYRALLDDETQPWATGLAIVEAETGLALDEAVLDGRWPIVEFASRLVAPEPPSGPGADGGARFALALKRADPTAVGEAQAFGAAATVDATALGDEPAVASALTAIRSGRQLIRDADETEQFRQLGYRLQEERDRSPFKAGDPADPAWRRYQSWAALSSFATGIRFDDGWLHVRNALDDAWPVVRDQMVAMLDQRSG